MSGQLYPALEMEGKEGNDDTSDLIKQDEKKDETAETTKEKVTFNDPEQHLEEDAYRSHHTCLYFKNDNRCVDFVLHYRQSQDSPKTRGYRETFLASLITEQLELETQSFDDDVFILIHAPFNVASKYAELLRFRKPLRKTYYMTTGVMMSLEQKTFFWRLFHRFDCLNVFVQDENKVKPIHKNFTARFSCEKHYLFDIPKNRDEFFTSAERSFIVDYILRRANFSKDEIADTPETEEDKLDERIMSLFAELEDDDEMPSIINRKGSRSKSGDAEGGNLIEMKDGKKKKEKKNIDFGVDRLIKLKGLNAAFPPHEPLPTHEEMKEKTWIQNSEYNTRRMLYETWASMRSILKFQPIDYVRQYFGAKIAFYFAWLGFYTTWLLPAAIMGVIVTVYGFVYMSNDPVVNEFCEVEKDTLMCPLCDDKCRFWKLGESCMSRRLAQVLDQPLNLAFAVFMALWACIFLEMWKRRQAHLSYRWNMLDLEAEDEPPRPEYLALSDKNYPVRKNISSGKDEPYVAFWTRRLPIMCCTFGSVIFLVMLAFCFLVGVIIYKLIMISIFRAASTPLVSTNARMFTSATGAMLSLVVIMALKILYARLAEFLTDMENHRTQTQYDNSITMKLFLLNFVNFYAPIMYVAYIQGKTSSVPGYQGKRLLKEEECSPAGCIPTLCSQMLIIFVGKQIFSSFMEYAKPRLIRFFQKYLLIKRLGGTDDENKHMELSRFQRDTVLVDPGPRPLFDEYLEMMIQFGFVTMFVPAFPLAPLLAFLNNVFEIRIDADKFVSQLRRPVARRSSNIGIWLEVLYFMSRLAVISNAAIIAFNTDLIARFHYRYYISEDGSLNGYVNYAMSYMNVSRFPGAINQEIINNTTYCRYFQQRENKEPYKFTASFWHILALKFIFVFTFENLVFALTNLVSHLITDFPEKLRALIRRENNLINCIVLKAELRCQQDKKALSSAFRKLKIQNIASKFESPSTKKPADSAAGNEEAPAVGPQSKFANLFSKKKKLKLADVVDNANC